MDSEQKCYILWLRCQNKSIYDIAEQVDVTYQSVHRYIKKIPVDVNNSEYNPCPKIPREKKLELINRYVFRQHRNNKRLDLHQLSIECNISEDTVLSFFRYIKAKKINHVHSSLYPKLTKWMEENNVTSKQLADAIEYSRANLSHILNGKYTSYMPFNIAVKISKFTGLSLDEIFEEQYDMLEKNDATMVLGDPSDDIKNI